MFNEKKVTDFTPKSVYENADCRVPSILIPTWNHTNIQWHSV